MRRRDLEDVAAVAGFIRQGGLVQIEVVLGDITAQRVDVIVNAAASHLLGGGGVDGAIHRIGGPDIVAECQELRRTRYPAGLPTGHAVATTAGNLPATWVIHTVGPIYRMRSLGPGRSEPCEDDPFHDAGLLEQCYRSSVRLAGELGAVSIAFPSISTGAFGWPPDDAAQRAVAGLREIEESGTSPIELVRLVAFSEGAFQTLSAAFNG